MFVRNLSTSILILSMAVLFTGCPLMDYQTKRSGLNSSPEGSGKVNSGGILSAANYDFGDIAVNGTDTYTVTVTNTEGTPVDIDTIYLSSDDMTIVDDNCSGLTNMTGTCTFGVEFTPTNKGQYTEYAQVPYNDGQVYDNLFITLGGTGFTVQFPEQVAYWVPEQCIMKDTGDEQRVYCWGGNHGNPNRITAYLGYPQGEIIGDAPGEITGQSPIDFGTTEKIKKLVLGEDAACVLFENGAVKCWGEGYYGQLGHGSDTDQLDPTTAPFVTLPRPAVDIKAGDMSVCALLDNNDLMCWGWNADGRLGANISSQREFSPVYVNGFSGNLYDSQVTTSSHIEPVWTDTEFSSAAVEEIAFDKDQDGPTYVAYKDPNANNSITVKEFNKEYQQWLTLGSEGFTGSSISSPSIDAQNGKFVAFSDSTYFGKVTVKYWDDNMWKDAGSPGFSQGMANHINIHKYDTFDILVAYTDSMLGGKVAVKYAQSSQSFAWQDVPVTTNRARTPIIKSDYNDDVYLAYIDLDNSNAITVKKTTDLVNWTDIGIVGYGYQFDFKIRSGIPYILFKDDANGGKGTVVYYTGSNWEVLGNAGFTSDAIRDPALTIDLLGITHSQKVAYSQQSDGAVKVMVYDGSEWKDYVDPNVTSSVSGRIGIGSDNNIPCVVYSDFDNSFIGVQKCYKTQVSTPVISPDGGSFGSPQTVTITKTDNTGEDIYYTTCGGDPFEAGVTTYPYTGSITVDSNTVLKAIAIKDDHENSAVNVAYFSFDPGSQETVTEPEITFTHISGSDYSVAITTPTSSTKIMYTTDGTEPDRYTGTEYTGTFTISGDTTVKAMAYTTNDYITDFSVGKNLCIVLNSEDVKCAGGGVNGRLGDGDTSMHYAITPQAVLNIGGEPIKKIMTSDHSCVLLENGDLKCWGENYFGALGDGTFNDNPFPTLTTSLVDDFFIAMQVSCIKDASGYKCWGKNYGGNLGLGHHDNLNTIPGTYIDLPTSANVVSFIPNENSTYILSLEGAEIKFYGWGFNGDYGRLALEAITGTSYDDPGYCYGDEPGEMGDNIPLTMFDFRYIH
jgi:alpha-tubulin suppressor-like RCC1 family protein